MVQKKIIAALLTIATATLPLSACGSDDNDGGNPDGGGEQAVTIGLVPKDSNEFYLATRDGAEKTVDADGNAELLFDAPRDATDAAAQISIIENVLTRGVDALLVAPVGPEVQGVLERAAAEGVKVVLFDNDIPEWKEGKTAYVGTDNRQGGELAGDYIVEQLDGKGTVGILSGLNGVPPLVDRVEGAKEKLEAAGIEVVSELETGCTREKGLAVAEDILTAHPDVSALYAACAFPALSAIEAIQGAEIDPDDILLVGFDANPEEIQAIQNGLEDASIAQFPGRMGEIGADLAIKAARGQKVRATVDSGTEVVTEENAAEFEEFK